MKDKLNLFFEDWGLPLFVVLMVMGAIVGLLRNWDKINSKDWPEKKDGLMASGMIVLYVFISVAIIGIVLSQIKGVDINI